MSTNLQRRFDRLGELPAATRRGATTFYTNLADAPDRPWVCRGTSCMLAGAQDIFAAVPGARGAYCLGYCDRSPVVLRADEGVALHCRRDSLEEQLERAPQERPRPSVRAVCPEAIVTRRVGRESHAELAAARSAGAYQALQAALAGAPDAVISAVERSGERGRGGAGFPAGQKWRRCAEAPGDEKVVIANGDEGDPGSFIDRVLMERDPHGVLEGLLLCAYAVGARQAIVFIRSEYPHAVACMQRAIEEARQAGLAGDAILGSDFDCALEVLVGQGSYVCGEETAMLNAIEGMRGEVRLRPPYPVVEGLHGKPTVVNNVETLVNIPWIIERGADAYAALGTEASSGTKALCLNHGFANPGIVEVEFGTSLREVIEDVAGGGRTPLAAVILGGPMGSVLLPDEWDVPVCYTAMGERGVQLGHGGLVALPEDADFRALLVHWLEFMADESCGKCTPCRLGSQRSVKLGSTAPSGEHRGELENVLALMRDTSLCAFGQLLPVPVQKLIDRFGDRIFADGAKR